MVRSLWELVRGNPRFMQRLNGWLTIFWVVMIPVSLYTGWVKSVTYVSALSLWALVSGHWSTWMAARVEVHQQEDANVQDVLDVLEDRVTSDMDNDNQPQPADDQPTEHTEQTQTHTVKDTPVQPAQPQTTTGREGDNEPNQR